MQLTIFAYWGYEGSTHPDIPTKAERYTHHWQTQANELFAALTERETLPQILLGYSMGGMLALQMAEQYPEKISGLIGLAAGFGDEFSRSIPNQYGALTLTDLSQTAPIPLIYQGDKTYDFVRPLNITAPLYFRNATNDSWVNYQTAKNIMAACPAAPSQQSLKSENSHRFELPADKAWLQQALQAMLQQ